MRTARVRLLIGTVSAAALAACAPGVVVGSSPATGSPSASGGTTSPAPSSPINSSAVVDELIARTNNERRSAGLPALTRNVNLVHAAQIQAEQMAARNQLDHDLPGAQYPTLGSRLTAVQYPMRAAAENIGEGFRSAAEAMGGWMASSGHRGNILSGSYTEMGAAVARSASGRWYWVQVFGSR